MRWIMHYKINYVNLQWELRVLCTDVSVKWTAPATAKSTSFSGYQSGVTLIKYNLTC